jgi:hypothetical protein
MLCRIPLTQFNLLGLDLHALEIFMEILFPKESVGIKEKSYKRACQTNGKYAMQRRTGTESGKKLKYLSVYCISYSLEAWD